MPGQPMKMARRVTDLEERAALLSVDVHAAIPRKYLDKPDPSDGVSRAWTDAREAVMRATLVLEHLGNLLRAKAGITEPGPAASLAAELREVDPRWNGRGVAAGLGDTQVGPTPPISGAPVSPLPDQLRSVFEGKQASDRDCVRWVARNLGIEDPDPASCPDPLAWSMLQYARMYPAGFWERVYPKIMPKTGADDKTAAFMDDGREDLKIEEALRSAQSLLGSDEEAAPKA